MRFAGLIWDDSRHYLDHLGPFCALAGCPLIFCEEELAQLARRFYPDLNVLYIPLHEIKLPEWIISCETRTYLDLHFPNQSPKLLWLPHGNSDKGWHTPLFEALDCDLALVYGDRMVDFMHKKGIFPKVIRIGNFRYEYFQKHLKKAPSIKAKSFFYAPTWDDAEKNNSFWEAFPFLAQQLPSDCQLALKLHPNTICKFAPQIEVLIGKYNQKNLSFLPDEPPIYPLLANYSAYIGDMSSIGYDFLTFNRPMYFLNPKSFSPLHQCGAPIDPKLFDFKLKNEYADQQKELYQYTFEKVLNWKEELYALCRL